MSLGEKSRLHASEINANNCPALQGKAELDLRITPLPSQEEQTENKRQQCASCQPVDPKRYLNLVR